MRTLILEGDLPDWIIAMVADKCGIPAAQISLDSRLFHDLKIYGDDADELLWDYVDAFQVDISELDFKKYFPPEASWREWPREFVPVTIRDLVESAGAKKWIAATSQ